MNIFGDLADPHRSSGPQRPPGIQWGGGVYHDTVYYGLTAGGRFAAIDLKLGKLLWLAPLTSSGGAESVSYAAPERSYPVSYSLAARTAAWWLRRAMTGTCCGALKPTGTLMRSIRSQRTEAA